VNLAEEAARMGADGYVVKPFEIDELLATIASNLN
jgi:DNA-binding response OmpR family regulator